MGDKAPAAASGPEFRFEVTQTSPVSMPISMLNAAIARGDFSLVRQASWVSPAAWAEVKAFVAKAGRIQYEANTGRSDVLLADNSDSLVVLSREWGDEWTVYAAVRNTARAEKWIGALGALLFPYPPPPPPEPLPDNIVPVMFWMQNPMTGGAYSRRRNITVQNWEEVASNYPETVRGDLGGLMSMDEPGSGGKLMLFHGPPGTGKTRAILSLISEWRSWCQASVVTDADRFFGDPTYLNDLLFDSVGMRDWLLLVIEDGDEFMNVTGRESKGQSVARLLNVADGIIGQGLNLLTLITTNVAMEELNPAVVRSGRCMANLHFGKFPEAEAGEWVTERGGVAPPEGSGELTLAEMYEMLRRDERAAKALARFGD